MLLYILQTSGYAPRGLYGHVNVYFSVNVKISFLPKIFFSSLDGVGYVFLDFT